MATPPNPTTRAARSVQRILEAAARLFGQEGYDGASMDSVARAAGVSKGLLHYHFRSKEHLLLEAQRATFRQIHKRFDDRFQRGERGLTHALEALDSLWEAIREMRAWAPFMVETMSLVTHGGPLREDMNAFTAETTALLESGIRRVFEGDLERLAVPPGRLARMVRTAIHGLVVELAYAEDDRDLAAIDQAYRDMRQLFASAALSPPAVGGDG